MDDCLHVGFGQEVPVVSVAELSADSVAVPLHDSVTVCLGADSLAAVDSSYVRLVDSIARFDGMSAVATVHAAVSADSVFGSASYVPSVAAVSQECRPSVAAGAGFQISALILLAVYVWLVFRHGADVERVMRFVWGKRGETGRHAGVEQPAMDVRIGFMASMLLSVGIAALRIDEVWNGSQLASQFPAGAAWVLVLAASVAALLVLTLQGAVLKLAGGITFSREFVDALLIRRQAFLSSAATVATPLVLLAAISPAGVSEAVLWVFVAVVALHVTFYVLSSLFLFIGQKVSILFWILYLCVVEAMPVGILAVGILRSMPS